MEPVRAEVKLTSRETALTTLDLPLDLSGLIFPAQLLSCSFLFPFFSLFPNIHSLGRVPPPVPHFLFPLSLSLSASSPYPNCSRALSCDALFPMLMG